MTTTAPAVTAPQGKTDRPSLVSMLAPIARDIAIPVAAYYALHALGYSDLVALLGGALCSAAIVVFGAVRARQVDLFAGVVLGGFLVGLAGALVSGDARMVIVRESFGTVVVGAAFLISALIGKPLTYAAARKAFAASPHLHVMEEAYRTNPAVRRLHSTLALAWGIALVSESALRIVLAYRLPVSTMAWLSSVLMIGVMSIMGVVSFLVIKLIKRTAN
ncbi:VC0807 family protein [Nocardia sp. NPDC057668]|uniref:VC0807 family protein n=1 Tax=Nocardia sp. NPDC057668 TaxID=3346202 RepID=UPI00367230F4